ncbi:MAG: type II secretion system ATPase GspE [Desulfobacterales bacterium]|jgi:general secretion pathway protein E|nr:type II secretion system ATPase GspE [Desulfobacteraceae bacterium]MBT7084556.1 type II secretion system ATPase GspE [Desulfobacterales bacterium]MBT7697204.1 type II secretion system ATPase GspE [Desulfobacterales bacterium]
MEKNLFDILNECLGVSEEDYRDAKLLQSKQGGSTGDILVENGVITESQLLESLSIKYNIPFQPVLSLENARTELTENMPIQFLKKYFMIPMANIDPDHEPSEKQDDGENQKQISDIVFAINNPACFHALDDLVRILGIRKYKVVLSSKESILSAINTAYDHRSGSAEQLVQDMEDNGSSIISEIEQTADLLDDTSDAPLIKLVNHIISQSIKARASDIHIEPYQNSFKVRYRVDGILYDLLSPPKHVQPALISRIKVMARLNIAEKRLPQDGRIEVKRGDQDIDIRVSTIPTSFGERVVLRLLNKSTSLLSLSELGLNSENLETIKRLIKSPNGIILVTGPTGSGKTTTLYAALSSINTPEINIITIEDPIEYQLKGIGQVQVNPKIGLTFASGLRSTVRQDPDVILVGEIRDKETAGIAVQAALTGHLVFSTVHTNDSASAITRLVDIGVEPFLLSSSIAAVVAQRLIRVLCTECRMPYEPDDEAMESIGVGAEVFKDKVIYRAKGCPDCFNTGYRGRKSIFEIMIPDENLKKMILKTHDSNQIKSIALKNNMVSLRHDGIQKVLDGVTSIAEVLRVTQE